MLSIEWRLIWLDSLVMMLSVIYDYLSGAHMFICFF